MKTNRDTKLFDWQKRNKGREAICPKCLRVKEVTVDHIIPVHLLEQLGLEDETKNDEDNFELTCYTCNKFKGARIDLSNPKTVPLLKKYIGKL
jgi:5-methylcytosine-specific restriction endonuclease McrA